jgi:hypothetical protein
VYEYVGMFGTVLRSRTGSAWCSGLALEIRFHPISRGMSVTRYAIRDALRLVSRGGSPSYLH